MIVAPLALAVSLALAQAATTAPAATAAPAAAVVVTTTPTTQPSSQTVVIPPIVVDPNDWHKTLNSLLNTVLATVGTAGTTVVVYFVVPWLKARSEQVKLQSQTVVEQTNLTREQTRSLIADRVKRWVQGTADAMADKYFPIFASAIASGRLKTIPEVKAQLYAMGKKLREDAVKQFSAQGLDVVAALGNDYLDGIIARAAVAVSPFPGKDTARAMLDGGYQLILDHGIYYVRTLNTVGPPGAPPLPPAAAAALAVTSAPALSSMQMSGPMVNVASPRPVASPKPVPAAPPDAGPPPMTAAPADFLLSAEEDAVDPVDVGGSIDVAPPPAAAAGGKTVRKVAYQAPAAAAEDQPPPAPVPLGNVNGFEFGPTATLPDYVEPAPLVEDPSDSGVHPTYTPAPAAAAQAAPHPAAQPAAKPAATATATATAAPPPVAKPQQPARRVVAPQQPSNVKRPAPPARGAPPARH